MKRIFCGFLASMIALSCPLAGCSKKKKNESRIDSDFETVTKETIGEITPEVVYVPAQTPDYTSGIKQCVISEEEDTSFVENMRVMEIDAENLDFREVQLPENSAFGVNDFTEDKWIVGMSVYEADDSEYAGGCLIGLYDSDTDEYTKLGVIPYHYGQYHMGFRLNEQYYIMQTSDVYDGVYACDLETGEVKTVENYEYEKMQAAAIAGEDSIAYCYCEKNTQDWIVKYCSVGKSAPKEIFRYNSGGNADLLPQTIMSDGTNVAL